MKMQRKSKCERLFRTVPAETGSSAHVGDGVHHFRAHSLRVGFAVLGRPYGCYLCFWENGTKKRRGLLRGMAGKWRL